MRLAAVLITTLIICIFCICVLPCPFGLCKEKRAKEEEKPALVTAAEKIARGKTFTDRKAENVSFTLSPIKAYIKISF